MGHDPPASTPELFESPPMTHVALFFALGAAMLVGALLTMGGAVVTADSPRWSIDLGIDHADLLPIAAGVALFGLLTFIAATCAILGTIGAA